MALRLLAALLLAALPVLAADEDAPTRLTLEDLYLEGAHDGPDLPDITWIENGAAYLVHTTDEDTGEEVWTRHDTRTGEASDWLRMAALVTQAGDSLEVDGIVLSPDENVLLVQTGKTKRWRYSAWHDHWVYDRATGDRHPLSEEGQEIHAAFSPDGTWIGYVRAGDLYVVPTAGGDALALTDDGSDVVFNGDPDWVYEEEFAIDEAWWWSPDGRRIAYLHTDSSAIGSFPLTKTGDGQYPDLQMLPYPKAGTDNSSVTLRVVEVATNATRSVSTVANEGYIPRVQWTLDPHLLTYQWLDREQNTLRLMVVDVDDENAMPRMLVEESSPTWVMVTDDLHFLDGRFVWTSQRDGFNHVYLYDLQGDLVRRLTEGAWEVASVEYVDEAGALLVTGRDSHLRRQVDLARLDGGPPRRLSEPGGWCEIDVAPNGQAYAQTRSTSQTRPRMTMHDRQGDLLHVIADDPMEDLQSIPHSEHRFFTFETPDGLTLYARLITPPDFDPGRQYPVLVYNYSGPESQRVRDRWDGSRFQMWHEYLAQEGYLVFTVDGRGTGGRGRDFMGAVYERLGEVEVQDQFAGIDYLRTLDFVDPDRIALWGWSYGGYVSSTAACQGQGKLAAAIAVAPVTDWRFYDTIYTERYMGKPQDNPQGYAVGAPLTYADQLDIPFLLIHGMSDDNVHPQNSLRLIAALQEAGKDFEVMVYPNKAHSISGEKVRYHLYRTMLRFLEKAIGPGTHPLEGR